MNSVQIRVIVAVADSGANNIIVVPGANSQITSAQTKHAVSRSRPRVIVAQLETPVVATAAAFEEGRSRGATTILNPAPAAPLGDDLLRSTDVLVPNEVEFFQLTGYSTESEEDLQAGAQPFFDKGVCAVVVTLGARGCVIMREGSIHRIAAPRVDAIDTTAAGDSFIGALAYELARAGAVDDESLNRGCRTAVSVGAVTVQRRGAQSSLPYLHEVTAER